MRDIGHVMMKDYTTMQTGGVARLIIVEDKKDLQELIQWYHRKIFILGSGSNLIVKDQGINGVVLKNEIGGIRIKGNQITAGSGVTMKMLSQFALQDGKTGLEFAEGIPGTVGGAVYMNAGFNADMASVVTTVEAIIYKSGHPKSIRLSNKECEFGFRKSIFQGMKAFITGVTFTLQQEDVHKIAEKMQKNAELREKRQPLNFPSSGTIFLKCKDIKRFYGFRINQVEMVAPGFIINHGGGNSYDIIQLIRKIQKESPAELEVEIV